jgi:putative aldouronate transport system permease protein
LGTALSLLVIALYAYPISRKDFKYRNQFTFFVFFTMIFGGGLVPWYMVCVQLLHLKNTIWAMIFPALMNGWYVLIMRTFFATSIPDSIIESAKIDGAGEWRTFFQIVLPLSLPGLATVALFNTLAFWNDWYLPLMFITKANLYNLQYTMYKMLANIQFLIQSSSAMSGRASEMLKNLPSETSRMAMCILAVGPIIFAYPFFQKYFVKGLTVGAVKG